MSINLRRSANRLLNLANPMPQTRAFRSLNKKWLKPKHLSNNLLLNRPFQFATWQQNNNSNEKYLNFLVGAGLLAGVAALKDENLASKHSTYKREFSGFIKEFAKRFQENSLPLQGRELTAKFSNNHKTNFLVHSRKNVQSSANSQPRSDALRLSILNFMKRPLNTQFISIVGDTPGAFGLKETAQVKKAISKILKNWVFDKNGKIHRDRLFMYGLTGSPKKDGRAGINPIVTSVLNQQPHLCKSMLGLCVDYGTSKVIDKFGADIPKHTSHVVVTKADEYIDPTSKASFPGANFGSDSPINNLSEITLLFAGGNQTAKEVVDALAHNSTILGVKGARGVNNPDTYLDGKPRAFLEAAELLEVVTKYVIRHKVTKVTSEDIDRVITAYIYGENKPTTKDFTDVENQKRLVFNPTSYDSNTKLELFLQMRALLKDPKVYTKLPNHCVILDISEIEKLPKVFNSLINREVSPRYYNLPKYKLETIDCSNGFNPTDNQYQRI